MSGSESHFNSVQSSEMNMEIYSETRKKFQILSLEVPEE